MKKLLAQKTATKLKGGNFTHKTSKKGGYFNTKQEEKGCLHTGRLPEVQNTASEKKKKNYRHFL